MVDVLEAGSRFFQGSIPADPHWRPLGFLARAGARVMSLPIHTPPAADEEQADGGAFHAPAPGEDLCIYPFLLISRPVSRGSSARTWAWSLPSAFQEHRSLASCSLVSSPLADAPRRLPPHPFLLHILFPWWVCVSPACSPMSEWMLPHPQPRPEPSWAQACA